MTLNIIPSIRYQLASRLLSSLTAKYAIIPPIRPKNKGKRNHAQERSWITFSGVRRFSHLGHLLSRSKTCSPHFLQNRFANTDDSFS